MSKTDSDSEIDSDLISESSDDEIASAIPDVFDDETYMYLMPGDWYQLKNIDHSKTFPYNLQTLQQEIVNQINSNADKLEFIRQSMNFPTKRGLKYEIDFHLDQTKFNLMADLLVGEKRHPIITFHGTNIAATNAIISNGYAIAGLEGGVRIANGAVYGKGVYSSPFYDKATYYARNDNGVVHILVNMMFLGVIKMIPASNSMTNLSDPVDGLFSDGSNTRVVYGLDQIICASSQRVIPVAVIHVSSK